MLCDNISGMLIDKLQLFVQVSRYKDNFLSGVECERLVFFFYFPLKKTEIKSFGGGIIPALRRQR